MPFLLSELVFNNSLFLPFKSSMTTIDIIDSLQATLVCKKNHTPIFRLFASQMYPVTINVNIMNNFLHSGLSIKTNSKLN